jgi:2-succinyl-6-hydroxy-2,4-cyclohexadiene-1-carboxylate synthase
MALPGHAGAAPLGQDDEPGFEGVGDAFIASLDAMEVQDTALVGYSMGARVAMHITLAYPERISQLVIIGGHPGLEREEARTGRQMLDRKRANQLRGGGLEAFLETWYRQPLFARLREHPDFERMFDDRCAGDAEGIATTLERLSTGHQEPLGERMATCSVPTLWVVGAEDTRYLKLLSPIAEAQEVGRLVVIPGSGHAVVTEAPEALADALNDFFT